jgi:hypothetical protein
MPRKALLTNYFDTLQPPSPRPKQSPSPRPKDVIDLTDSPRKDVTDLTDDDGGGGWTTVMSSSSRQRGLQLQDELDAAKRKVLLLQDALMARELQDAENKEVAKRWPSLHPKDEEEPPKTVGVEHSRGFSVSFSPKGTMGPGISQRGECAVPALLPF